ncbi:CBS domain-containing protein, partial [Clostridium botulinum]
MNSSIELIYTVKNVMKTDFIKVFKNEAISSAFNKMAKLYKDEVLIVDEDDNIIG